MVWMLTLCLDVILGGIGCASSRINALRPARSLLRRQLQGQLELCWGDVNSNLCLIGPCIYLALQLRVHTVRYHAHMDILLSIKQHCTTSTSQ